MWPSAVHLTAHAMLMAAYTGTDSTSALAFTGNRNARSHGEVMTCMFSPLLVRLDCAADLSFEELLTATAERFERGQHNSHVPYDELLELVAGESHRRGEPVRLGTEFNFLSQATQTSRARRTRLVWNAPPEAWACYGGDSYLRAYELRDAAVISLNASAAVLDAPAVEAFLRGYERLLLLPPAELAAAAGRRSGRAGRLSARAHGRSRGQPEPAFPVGRRRRRTGSVVAELNGLSSVDPAANYSVAGGRVLRIPAVLEELRGAGLDRPGGVRPGRRTAAGHARRTAGRGRPGWPPDPARSAAGGTRGC